MKNKTFVFIVVNIILLILFANFSLAQELQESQSEKINLENLAVKEVTSLQAESEPIKKEEQISPKEQGNNKNNDHEGNRLKKVTYNIDAIGNNKTTYYWSDNFVQEKITNGTILNYTYYYLNDKMIASKFQNGDKLYYHPDHLGSTTLVTNQSGDVVEDDVYLPFGAIYIVSSLHIIKEGLNEK